MKMTSILVWIPSEYYDWLKRKAKKEKSNLQNIVSEILVREVQNQMDKDVDDTESEVQEVSA